MSCIAVWMFNFNYFSVCILNVINEHWTYIHRQKQGFIFFFIYLLSESVEWHDFHWIFFSTQFHFPKREISIDCQLKLIKKKLLFFCKNRNWDFFLLDSALEDWMVNQNLLSRRHFKLSKKFFLPSSCLSFFYPIILYFFQLHISSHMSIQV